MRFIGTTIGAVSENGKIPRASVRIFPFSETAPTGAYVMIGISAALFSILIIGTAVLYKSLANFKVFNP